MGTVTSITRVKYGVGQLVHHRLFDYRGVVVDVDENFQGSEAWYETMAKSRPPKDKPWYQVLVHGREYSTYVAEQNLEPDPELEPIEHPLLAQFFVKFENGGYISNQASN